MDVERDREAVHERKEGTRGVNGWGRKEGQREGRKFEVKLLGHV